MDYKYKPPVFTDCRGWSDPKIERCGTCDYCMLQNLLSKEEAHKQHEMFKNEEDCACNGVNKENCKKCNPPTLAEDIDESPATFRKFESGLSGQCYDSASKQQPNPFYMHNSQVNPLIPPNGPIDPEWYGGPINFEKPIMNLPPNTFQDNKENTSVRSSVGRKEDGSKSRPDLIPPLALLEVGRVMKFGAKKYAIDNWRGLEKERLMAAAMRHMLEFQCGRRNDEESELSVLAHAAASMLMLLELSLLDGKLNIGNR